MDSTTRVYVERAGERRTEDRRKVDLAFSGEDRRVGERRSGNDRRA